MDGQNAQGLPRFIGGRPLIIVRVVLALLVLTWIPMFFRSSESALFLAQLTVSTAVAIVAARYFKHNILPRFSIASTSDRSIASRFIRSLVRDYSVFLVGGYALLTTLGLFGILEHFTR